MKEGNKVRRITVEEEMEMYPKELKSLEEFLDALDTYPEEEVESRGMIFNTKDLRLGLGENEEYFFGGDAEGLVNYLIKTGKYDQIDDCSYDYLLKERISGRSIQIRKGFKSYHIGIEMYIILEIAKGEFKRDINVDKEYQVYLDMMKMFKTSVMMTAGFTNEEAKLLESVSKEFDEKYSAEDQNNLEMLEKRSDEINKRLRELNTPEKLKEKRAASEEIYKDFVRYAQQEDVAFYGLMSKVANCEVPFEKCKEQIDAKCKEIHNYIQSK